MARPRKEQPNHGKYYEVKMVTGHAMDGTPIRKSFYSEVSKEDARRKGNEYITEQKIRDATGIGFSTENITFAAYAEKWLKTVDGTVRANTYQMTYYIPVHKHIIPFFGNAYISDIKQMDVQRFFNQFCEKYSPSYCAKARIALGLIFESAETNGAIKANPMKSLRTASKKKEKGKKVYTKEETELVLQFAETHPNGLAVILLLTMGLRRSELLGLQWGDIDFDRGIVSIVRGVTAYSVDGKMEMSVDDTKNKYSTRYIPIPKLARPKLEEAYRNRIGEYVITNPETKTAYLPSKWKTTFSRFMKDMLKHYMEQTPPIEIPKLNPHELRHTCTSNLVNSGKDLFSIASVLGWGDLKMLRQRYAHSDIESIREKLDL